VAKSPDNYRTVDEDFDVFFGQFGLDIVDEVSSEFALGGVVACDD